MISARLKEIEKRQAEIILEIAEKNKRITVIDKRLKELRQDNSERKELASKVDKLFEVYDSNPPASPIRHENGVPDIVFIIDDKEVAISSLPHDIAANAGLVAYLQNNEPDDEGKVHTKAKSLAEFRDIIQKTAVETFGVSFNMR